MEIRSINVNLVKDNGPPNYEPLFRLPRKNYPACPKCGKATFLHHDYQLYSNFRCNDRKNCNHSFSVVKLVEVPATSSKDLKLESFTMKRMRHPFHIVLAAFSPILYC